MLIFILILHPAAALAGRRAAFVVGVSDYAYCPKLPNPRRDAAAMTKALKSLGFDVITSIDQDLDGLTGGLEQFYRKAEGAEAAVFYYAGHGLQARGVNYLLPKDARLRSETRLKQEAIALQDVIAAMEERAQITLAFLDACRDNPLGDELKRSIAGAARSAAVPRGLAPMSIRRPDTMIVFATAPNKTAQDGSGRRSPFTEAMIRRLAEPGLEVEPMMKRVTRDVARATKGEQVPERLSRLTSEFVFNEAATRPPSSLPGGAPAPVSAAPQAANPCASSNPPISCLWRKR
jgi:uncharacterized caspase-like protein